MVSPLPYAVVDSATLHNLKEAPVIRTVEPFAGAVLCKHRVAEHATEARVLIRYVLLLRQPADLNLHCAGIILVSQRLLTPSAPFTSRAAACIAVRLCCRVTVTLHQKRNVNPLHQTRRHFDRVSEKAK